MKKYDKPELRRKAASYFKTNPDVKEFYATEDGMFFANVSLAKDHNKKVVKGELHTISKGETIIQKITNENPQVAAIMKKKASEKGVAAPEPLKPEGSEEQESAKVPEQEKEPEAGQASEAAPEQEEVKEPAAEFTQLDLEHLQEEYEEVTGKKPGNRKADTLQKEIEDAKAKQ